MNIPVLAQSLVLFDWSGAFSHPITILVVIAVAGSLAGGRWLIGELSRRGAPSASLEQELLSRWTTWCWLSPAIILPILFGRVFTILAVCLLSLLCYREYVRTTGLFRNRMISVVVVGGILLVTFASLDDWQRLYWAAAPITVGMLAIAALQTDKPEGYIQRVALGVFGYLLLGHSLGYLGQFANIQNVGNGTDYRPIVLLILIGVAVSDVSAYTFGKMIGGPKLMPNTSPNKTIAGSLGSLIVTTLLVAILGHFIFSETPVDQFWRLIAFGALVGGLAQLGDLMLSAIKRDVGVKDTGTILPGHGGFLDRFNSLILVPAAVFHYLSVSLEDLGPLGTKELVAWIWGG